MMQEHRANFRSINGHPNVVVWLDGAFDVGADWILGYFESEVRRGVVFHPGETVQIGWMIVMLKADELGDLEIWEPRFDSMPIKWARGANSTSRHLTLQQEVCAQVGVEPDYPSLRQSGIVAADFLHNTDGFHMVREIPGGTDSGWILRRLDSKESDARHCSLFEISISHSAIIPFIALPAGSSVTHSKSKIEISCGQKNISSDSNQFLSKILASPVFV
jgi:hypothetical protein